MKFEIKLSSILQVWGWAIPSVRVILLQSWLWPWSWAVNSTIAQDFGFVHYHGLDLDFNFVFDIDIDIDHNYASVLGSVTSYLWFWFESEGISPHLQPLCSFGFRQSGTVKVRDQPSKLSPITPILGFPKLIQTELSFYWGM